MTADGFWPAGTVGRMPGPGNTIVGDVPSGVKMILSLGLSACALRSAILSWSGAPAGYTMDPQENIVYADKHDNQTLFDVVQLAAPDEATIDDRAQMAQLGHAIVLLSQGVPFQQAGTEMLRSKSFDRDSYNSGDWFNFLDFTYQDNGFGRGLPVAEKNENDWPIMQPLLANPDLKPNGVRLRSAWLRAIAVSESTI